MCAKTYNILMPPAFDVLMPPLSPMMQSQSLICAALPLEGTLTDCTQISVQPRAPSFLTPKKQQFSGCKNESQAKISTTIFYVRIVYSAERGGGKKFCIRKSLSPHQSAHVALGGLPRRKIWKKGETERFYCGWFF
jgi:hypothetical protein